MTEHQARPEATILTAVTEMFGIRLPVVAGGLQWLANAEYVAAAGRAGIIGFITAASLPGLDELRAEIRKCRDLCDGAPFGVNVSMLPKLIEGDRTHQVIDVICDEGVRFVETSGRNPEPYLPTLKGAGIKVLHKVPAVRYARKAQEVGVDAVSIVGAECGGHPGLDLIGTFVQARMAADLDIPYLIGGGVGTGAQVAAALAMGASGVVIGTRFLVAEEIWAHPDYKRRLIEATERDTELIMGSIRNTTRVLRNDTSATVRELESTLEQISIEDLIPYVAGKVGRGAYETGDWRKGALSVGQSVVFADRVEPLAEIVAGIEAEAMAAIARLDAMVAM
ncbi:MAG: nitronate monooxygenase [Hyphomicrobiales bacterium]|nr:nitronate monooxygenase [Hyphomicrobiales bacterium]MCP5374116.1 nitronate monooxygenase [Hyphomicrobiales bacterium]